MSAPFVEHPVHRQRRVSKYLIVKLITVCTNEIYQLYLKEIVLNRSTKRAMTGSFRRTHCSYSSISKKVSKTKKFVQTAVTTNKIYRQDFLEVVIVKRSTKEAITVSFRRAHFDKHKNVQNDNKKIQQTNKTI